MPKHRHTTMINAVSWAFATGGMRPAVAALALLSVCDVSAAGLGDMQVQSALGQPLRATITLLGNDDPGKTAACFNARLTSLDGVLIATPRIALGASLNGTLIKLTTTLPVGEPALALMVESRCGDSIRKEFALLLDPPINSPSIPLVTTDRSEPGTGTGRRQSSARAQVDPVLMQQVPAQVLLPRPVAPPTARRTKRPKSVLRMSASDTDADLLSAVGLQLALADRLGVPSAKPDNAVGVPELANSAGLRAARARFAAVMRDDVTADGTAPATEEKLQRLQSKLQMLETETARLKQASQRDTAVLASLRRDEGNSHWLLILIALLVLSTGVITWLILRIKRLKQTNTAWNWEDTVPAAAGQHRAAAQAPVAPSPVAATVHTASDIFATAPVVASASDMLAVKASTGRSPMTAAHGAPLEFTSYEIPAATTGTITATSKTAATTTREPDHLGFAELRIEHPDVEEISDVMQEAEFWISLQDAARAIEVLEPYATLDQTNSPLPWIYLFDLYIELGMQDKYGTMRERFHRVFNARVPDWDEHKATLEAGASNRLGIEHIPHVSQTICALWQTDQIVPYLESLLIDDREGNRSGFDLSIYQEIMFLIVLANEILQMRQPVSPPNDKPGLTLVA